MSLESFLAARCRNTAHKATTLVRYYLYEGERFSVCLHKFRRDDERGVYHDHPFDWVSLFFGSYVEQRPNEKPRRKWFINTGGAQPHRVEDTRGMWTLVFRGPETREWSYTKEEMT